MQKGNFRLQALNMTVATLAGIISIVGGVYSLKMNFFQPPVAYGELLGFVRDERLAKPLRSATVEVLDDSGSVLATLSTDENGRYFMKDLKEGRYEVKASAVYHDPEERIVSIQKKQTSTVYFDLTPVEPPVTPAPSFVEVPYSVRAPAYPAAPSPFQEVPNSGFNQVLPGSQIVPRSEEMPYQQPGPGVTKPNATGVLLQTGVQLLEQWVSKKRQVQQQAQQETLEASPHSTSASS